MFKYKISYLLFLTFTLLFIAFVYINFNKNINHFNQNDDLMRNNIEFSGIITNLNISNNHAFGILQLKIEKSNKNYFNPKTFENLFPYAINDSIAEIYHNIPIILKKGYIAKVNSNSKTIFIYDKNKFLYEWEITIVSSETDKNFVKSNTKLK